MTEAVRLQALQAMAQALLGCYTEASEIAEASLFFARTNGLEREIGILLWVLGFLSVVLGDCFKPERQLVESSHILNSLGLLDIQAAALVARGYTALGLDDLELARHHFLEALQSQPLNQSRGLALLALPGIAMLIARNGHIIRGIEVDSLAARFPLIANAPFFEDVARQSLEKLIALVPAEMVAQARARGRAAALEGTIPELLTELHNLDR